MLRRHIVLLIAICPSDGDVKPGGPLGAFWEEQAMSRHRISPSPFLSSSSSHTTQLHYTNSYTYSHPNLNILQHRTDTLPTRNVVCPSGAWFKNRPHLTSSLRFARNLKHVIVQWVGIRTDGHLKLIQKIGSKCVIIKYINLNGLWYTVDLTINTVCLKLMYTLFETLFLSNEMGQKCNLCCVLFLKLP